MLFMTKGDDDWMIESGDTGYRIEDTLLKTLCMIRIYDHFQSWDQTRCSVFVNA